MMKLVSLYVIHIHPHTAVFRISSIFLFSLQSFNEMGGILVQTPPLKFRLMQPLSGFHYSPHKLIPAKPLSFVSAL